MKNFRNRNLISFFLRQGTFKSVSAFFLALVLTIALIQIPSFKGSATTQQQINQAEKEKQELQQQQAQNDQNLQSLRNDKGELVNKVWELSDQLEEIGNNLETLEVNITDKQAQIEATRIALEEAIATEEWQYECMVI